MNTLISPDRASHWYRRESGGWSPFYEVESANGNGLRPVTLRDARKVSAVPSVTNVLNILAKPGLEAWKATQYIEAALTLPKRPDEPLDEYAKRVVEDAEAKSATARDFGSRIHKAIEMFLVDSEALLDPDSGPYMDYVMDWLSANVGEIYGAEIIVGASEGFAGRLDLDCELTGHSTPAGRALIDFKTQGVKSGKQPTFYLDWARQLAAYHYARQSECKHIIHHLVSVVIDSGTPKPPFVQVWQDAKRHWLAFQHCLALWQDEKDYRP